MKVKAIYHFIKVIFNMYNIIVLSSVTYAIKAQKLLLYKGIRSELNKSSTVKAVRGCGYGIKVKSEQIDEATAVLAANGIKMLGIVESE